MGLEENITHAGQLDRGIAMKKSLLLITILLAGCNNTTANVWEETKTVGRHIGRKGREMMGKELIESRQVSNIEDFKGPGGDEFIPLRTEDLKATAHEVAIPQSKTTPGAKNSFVPSIDQFRNPDQRLSTIFSKLHFRTDEHMLREKEDYASLNRIAEYMKKHKDVYIFVAGHCDERASEAYNLSLGTRRANSIRNLLIKRGVDSNRVFTISYGKELPLDQGHNHTAWAKNRRAEFKVYKRGDHS